MFLLTGWKSNWKTIMAHANSYVCWFLSWQTCTKSNPTIWVCWSLHLHLLSITPLYLSHPPPLSLCLCPLPTAVVSGFHNGSQDALWLCGSGKAQGNVWVWLCVCVCGRWEVMRSFRHMRGFPSAAWSRVKRFKGTYTLTFSDTHSQTYQKALKLGKFTHYVC